VTSVHQRPTTILISQITTIGVETSGTPSKADPGSMLCVAGIFSTKNLETKAMDVNLPNSSQAETTFVGNTQPKPWHAIGIHTIVSYLPARWPTIAFIQAHAARSDRGP